MTAFLQPRLFDTPGDQPSLFDPPAGQPEATRSDDHDEEKPSVFDRLFLAVHADHHPLPHGHRLCLASVPAALPYRHDDGTVEWMHCTWWTTLPRHEKPSNWVAAALGLDDRWQGPVWLQSPLRDRS